MPRGCGAYQPQYQIVGKIQVHVWFKPFPKRNCRAHLEQDTPLNRKMVRESYELERKQYHAKIQEGVRQMRSKGVDKYPGGECTFEEAVAREYQKPEHQARLLHYRNNPISKLVDEYFDDSKY